MRGVSNFEEFKEFGNPAHPFTSQWYPDPKEQLTGALIDGVQTDYNVFNLNPYVFFVHKTLGMNGYGFSVDDDTADVGSLGNHLQIAYGSTAATAPGTTQKLQNLNYYTGGAPYGALQAQGYVDNTTAFGKFYRDQGYTVIVLPTSLVARLVAADANVTGALASDENGILKPGTRVVNIASSVPDVFGAGKGVVIVTSQGVPPPSTDGPVLKYTFSGFNTLLPVVSSHTPTSGTAGTTVDITGSNFGFTSGATFVPTILSVTFNGIPVAASDIQVHSASALTVTVPGGATSGKISVRSAAGTGYSSTDFTIGGAVAPTLLSASPSNGSIRTEVTLTGTGFTGVTNIKFNGVSALSFIFVNDTTVKAVVPNFGAAVGTIAVFTFHGDTSASPPVIFTVNPPASISFSPMSGAVGTPITLTGTGFIGASAVTFNLTPATSFTVVNDTTIQVAVPAGATDGPISVTTPGGTGASSGSFDVTPGVAPSLASFSPGTGSAGTPVTLTGANFLNATGVTFNGVAATFVVINDTTLTTMVPALATTGLIVVSNPHGSSSNPTSFIVTATVFPSITSFSPGSGPISTPVTLTGTGFTGVTEVHFNGIEANFTFISDTEIRTHVPSGATTGTISVTNSAGTGFSPTSFHVSDDDVITLLSNNIVDEKLPVGTLVGTLSSTPSNVYTYQLGSGGDNASFTVAGNHILSAAIFDFNLKSQYHITVKTFLSGAEVASNQFTIDVQRASIIVAGDSNGSSKVVIYSSATRDEVARFNAFGPAFKGGVRVATADVNGDGVVDIIIGAGNGRSPTVKVVDGTKLTLVDANGTISDGALLYGFNAFAASFTGGIYVAAADLNQDGFADVVVGRGTGQSRVRVFDAQTGNQSADFLAFSPSFAGGVRVAAVGQIGGHHAQVVVGSGSGGGRVKVVDATLLGNVQGNGVIADTSLLASFLPYGTSYTLGVFLSVGDVNGDAFVDIVTSRADSPNVRVFDGSTLHGAPFTDPTKLFDFLAFSPSFKGGVRVGMAQINGRAHILAAPGNPGGVPVKIADSSKLDTPGWLQPDNQIADAALLDSFFVLNDDGIFVGG